MCQEVGGERVAIEIGVKWEVGLKYWGKWHFEVGGNNRNYKNYITN